MLDFVRGLIYSTPRKHYKVGLGQGSC
jgi:hypothetical protein